MTALLIFLVSLLILIPIGVPIFVSIGLSALSIWVWLVGSLTPSILLQKMFTGIDSFPLAAIPFFMLAGELMNVGGLSPRLVSFAQQLIGWIRGGLGFAVILSSMFVAAILGSASASAAMIGMVMIPAMVERGYKKDFSSALIASAGSIGPVIPPSIPLIVYGVIAQVSIAKLFVGGYIPGLLMGAVFMVYTYFHARKNNYPAEKIPTLKGLLMSAFDASLTLLLPIIIMGGILRGIFTPTEAGVVAVVYVLVIGVVIYRKIKLRDLPSIFLRAAKSTAMILMIMSTASLLSWVLTMQRVPQTVTGMMTSMSSNPLIFLILVNIFVIIMGMFLDAVSGLTILAPVLLPAAIALGIDPLFFGVMLTVNLSIGVLTPPVGLNLYVTSSISKLDILEVARATYPFLVMIGIVLLVMILFPNVVTYLPNVLVQ